MIDTSTTDEPLHATSMREDFQVSGWHLNREVSRTAFTELTDAVICFSSTALSCGLSTS